MEIATLYGNIDSDCKILLNSDETKLFSCGRDKTIKVWDLNTDTLLNIFKEHTSSVYKILLNSDETKLISSSGDNSIKIWDVSEFIEIPIKSANKIF